MKNENEFFFSTFWKITVGGFINQLIKKFWPYWKIVEIDILYFNLYGISRY